MSPFTRMDVRSPSVRVLRIARLCCVLTVLPFAAAVAQTPGSHLSQLAKQADLIAFGQCQAADSAWDADHRFIVTTLRFYPIRSFKGVAGPSVTVKVLGGHVGTHGMNASHSAAMRSGEEAVLFLQRSRFGDYFVITGGADGKLPVRTDPASGQRRLRGALSLEEFGHWVAAASAP